MGLNFEPDFRGLAEQVTTHIRSRDAATVITEVLRAVWEMGRRGIPPMHGMMLPEPALPVLSVVSQAGAGVAPSVMSLVAQLEPMRAMRVNQAVVPESLEARGLVAEPASNAVPMRIESMNGAQGELPDDFDHDQVFTDDNIPGISS